MINKIIYVTKYIIMNLYFLRVLDNKVILMKIQMKIHIINDFKINILIETNVFISHKFLLNCASQFVIIINYQNIKIFVKFIIKPHSQINE